MLPTSAVVRSLVDDWGLADPAVTPHHGGMNSQTWIVTDGSERWVAKSVPATAARRFVAGLSVAVQAATSGVPVGIPRPTLSGRRFAVIDTEPLALLDYVEGRELDGRNDADQRMLGRTLGRVHHALVGADIPGLEPFHRIDPAAMHLEVPPWIRPAIDTALDEWARIPPQSLTMSALHTDPAPEAFRWDATSGVCGLIDWDFGMFGPLMFDVASAVMYLGGPVRARPFVSAYMAEAVVEPSELERSLPVLLRLRWAVQADYFAHRIAAHDFTGIDGPADNEKGLEDARRGLRRPVRGA